ncbi:MAG TPA: Calx-beta domain-containing protein, partial [Planctomycetaceae bacterium]|nr:Calx-beta domain-containing protein [Planctomycetaceae bacterium]
MAATDATKLEGNSGNTPFTFTITREGVINQAASVQVRVDLFTGTGKADATDFVGTPPTTTLSFAAGETSKTFVVNIAGDKTIEPDEEFAVTMLNPVNATLKNTSATGVILSDDLPPTLSIAATNASRNEGDSGQVPLEFTVTRHGDASGSASVTYAVAGSGTNAADAADFGGTDFGGSLPTGTISFSPGETTKTITVNITGDSTIELDESFTVTLSNVSGAGLGTATATGTIVNDDASLSIAATSATKSEGNSGNTAFTFTITRTGSTSGSASVNFAVAGSGSSAADDADFGGLLPGGTINFAAGETSKTVTVNVTGDTTIEPDEGFTVTLSNPTGANLETSAATGTILNDDSLLSIAATSESNSEGNSGSTAFTFTITRTGNTSSSASATFAVTGWGASPANAGDFGSTFPSGTISFAAG